LCCASFFVFVSMICLRAGEEARLHRLQDVLARARASMERGDVRGACAIIDRDCIVPEKTNGSVQYVNAQLFKLRAIGTFTTNSSSAELFRGEIYAVMALKENPCDIESWEIYVETRKRRQGYTLFLREIEEQTVPRYRLHALGLARFDRERDRLYRLANWLFLKGMLLRSENDKDGAERALRSFLAIDNGKCHGLKAIAKLLYDRHAYAEAHGFAAALEREYPSEMNADMLRVLGFGHAAMGRYDEAESSYRELLRLLPNDPDTLSALASVAYHRDRAFDEVEPLFQKSLAFDADRWETWQHYWAVALSQGKLDALRRVAEEHARMSGHAQLTLALIETHQGRYPKALGRLRRLVEDMDSSIAAEAYLLVSLAESRAGDARRAAAQLAREDKALMRAFTARGLDEILAFLGGKHASAAKRERVHDFIVALQRSGYRSTFFASVFYAFMIEQMSEDGEEEISTAETLLLLYTVNDARVQDLEARFAHRDELTRTRFELARGRDAQLRKDLDRLGLRVADNARRIHLSEREIEVLRGRLDALTSRLETLEPELVAMIESGDRGLAERLDVLARGVEANAAGLRRAGSSLNRLTDWRNQEPRQVANDAFRLSKYISIGPSTPFGSINLLAMLEDFVSFLTS